MPKAHIFKYGRIDAHLTQKCCPEGTIEKPCLLHFLFAVDLHGFVI